LFAKKIAIFQLKLRLKNVANADHVRTFQKTPIKKSTIYLLSQLHVSRVNTPNMVNTVFRFRRHGTDGRTDVQIDGRSATLKLIRPPREGRIIITLCCCL